MLIMTRQDAGAVAPARILLVDDVPSNLQSLEAALHDLGAVLVKAGSGEEALRRLLAEDFDVILMDVRMAGLDGYDTARLIRGRDRCRDVPIIFVTAHDSPEDVVVQAYKDGAADHLTKPLVPEVLRAKVRRHLELAVRARGRVEPVIATGSDETERRRAEEALRESAAVLRGFYDTAPFMMGVVELTADDILHVSDNAATARLFGIAPGRMRNRTARQLGVPDAHVRLWRERYRESERRGAPLHFEYLHDGPDGGRWLAATVCTIGPGPDGRTRYSYVVEDATERRRVEEALREADRHKGELLALLDTLQNNAPVGFAFVDRDCRYVRVNAALAAMNGAPAAECVGRTVAEVVPLLWPRVGPFFRRVLEAGAAVTDHEVSGETAAHPGEVRHWLVSYYPVRAHGAVAGVGVLVADITERKRLEEELRRRAEQLQEADRLKDEFLAMLSHELRNPLAPVRNGLDILRLSGGAADTLEMMDRQLQQLVRLTDDLLDVSRLTRGQIRLHTGPVDLAEAVARAVETVRPVVEARRHELAVALPPGPLPLEADLPRLAQAFANLLHNAAKFTPEGGRLALSVAVEGPQAVVRVRDNGVGIRPEMLPRVFELFAQADQSLARSPGGLGVGLTLVRSLVEMHGGAVEAHSDGPGRGSEFVVRLPIADGGWRVVDSADNPPSAVRHPQSRRVLVVDDNRDAAESLAMLLRAAGHEVCTAHAGPTALEAARAFRPGAVLLDIGLPGMDGYEVARRLRREADFERALLVAVTGYGQDEDRRRSREAGFDHHLVKPADLETLREILSQVTAGSG